MTKVAILKEAGLSRVLNGAVGMTFVVDSFTDGVSGTIANVRDYRYERPDVRKPYQIWSISANGYELIREQPTMTQRILSAERSERSERGD